MNTLIEGQNKYCGPAVLSILLNKPVDECAELFRRGLNTTSVTTSEMIDILVSQRCEVKHVESASGCSLYSCFHIISRTPGAYIITVPKHVVAVEVTEDHQVLLCDNHTKFPINGAASARLGQRVVECLKVELRPDPILLKTEYKALKFTERIEIWKHDIYKDSNDNQSKKLGTIYYRNNNEFSSIIGAIRDMWEV